MSPSSDEHVIYSTRLSKRLFLRPLLLATIAVVAAVVCGSLAPEYAQYAFWGFIAVAVLMFIPAFVRYFSSRFVVTDQRVVIRHGFLRKTSYEMFLKKIESIAVNQSLSDRWLWGCGTLVITGTGGSVEEFDNVGHAVAFEEYLNKALKSI
jgi:uncharacterized membrane protein YdbT with pleckstrin-like domain